MDANMAKAQSLTENAFTSAVEKLAKDESGNFTSDSCVQVDVESGELQIYDDKGHLIEKIVIFDQVNSNGEKGAFSKRVAASVKAVLMILSTRNIFDVPRFMKPLSVSLIDEDLVVTEELLFAGDDILRLGDLLLEDLDADLDDFLANLLAGVK